MSTEDGPLTRAWRAEHECDGYEKALAQAFSWICQGRPELAADVIAEATPRDLCKDCHGHGGDADDDGHDGLAHAPCERCEATGIGPERITSDDPRLDGLEVGR